MPAKRKQVNVHEVPEHGPPLDERGESDDESELSSDADSTDVVPLNADDSMFRPSVVNRVEPVAPPLLTRQAHFESIPVDQSHTRQDGQARRSSRRTSGRTGGMSQTKDSSQGANDGVASIQKADQHAPSQQDAHQGAEEISKTPEQHVMKSKAKRARVPSFPPDGRSEKTADADSADMRDCESPSKKRREAEPSSEPSSVDHTVHSSEDKKGKRKKQQSPEPECHEEDKADEMRMDVEVSPGDAAEAEDLRRATEASLRDVRGDRVGESSGCPSHAQTGTSSAIQSSASTPPDIPAVNTLNTTSLAPPAQDGPAAPAVNLTLITASSTSSTPLIHDERPSTPGGTPSTPDRISHSTPGGTPSTSSTSGTPSTRSTTSPIGSPSTDGGTPSPSVRRTFATARLQISGVQSRPVTSSRSAQDPNEFRVRELPERCQVDNPNLQDDMLREFYRDLPNLILGAFVSWSQLRGSGQFPFSHWGDVAPTMDFDNALAFINFVANGRFVNPSRASPLLTRAVRTTASGFRMNLYVENEPAILLSTIYVRQSHLLNPPARGLRQHLIAGIGHTQEWERQVSFICMVFGQPALRAQISADVLTYSTRSDLTQNYTSPLGQFSSTQSPSIRVSARTFPTSSDGMALAFNEPVPVYDARTTPVNMSDVNSLFNLPRFEGEVPPNSFAAVGYTTNAYLSNRDNAWHVSCNIRFVVVVGTPSDGDEGAPVPLDD